MTVRTAIIGTGHAARHHVAAAKAVGLDITVVSGRDLAKARALIDEMAPDAVARPVFETLGSTDIDAVIIALPAAAQPEIAAAAFESGKHVLCEKPLASTVAGAELIEAAWRASGKVGMVNFCFRLIPEIEAFTEQVRSGVCGPLNLIQAEWILGSRLDRTLPYSWKADVDSGGGVLQTFGSHLLDYLFHDRADVRVLAASQKTLVKSRYAPSGSLHSVSADETATVLFDLPEACPVVMHLSVVTQPATGHRLIARGSEGTLVVRNVSADSPGGPFRLTFSASTTQPPTEGVTEAGDGVALSTLFARVLTRFADAVRLGRESYQPDIAAGVQATRLIETIRHHSYGVSMTPQSC